VCAACMPADLTLLPCCTCGAHGTHSPAHTLVQKF